MITIPQALWARELDWVRSTHEPGKDHRAIAASYVAIAYCAPDHTSPAPHHQWTITRENVRESQTVRVQRCARCGGVRLTRTHHKSKRTVTYRTDPDPLPTHCTTTRTPNHRPWAHTAPHPDHTSIGESHELDRRQIA